ncbi:MAG TPA: TetR/AcrR family transcriptional regulator [Myxococcota bacterium]|nr:TetR/AcrR family transcriptional regulator [Myxococcota bacterium]
MTETSPDPLDERLVEVGLKLLEREGLEALTLRRIAREAGVSHGAPLRHFAGLSDLRAEIAARGFRILSDAVDEASGALPAGAGPRARLHAAGVAYVEAAVAHPSLFALMFRPEALDRANAAFARESFAAFERLLRLVRAAQDDGFEPASDVRVLAGAVWASVHGLASLWSQGAFAGAVPGARLEDALTVSLRLTVGEQGVSA